MNDYYPSGMRWCSNGNPLYKYKFGGKELQTELNLNTYDFHARQQDPQLGRFWVVDPMAYERVNLSSFNYVQNNPIGRVDPTGMLDELGWYTNEYGDAVHDKTINSRRAFKQSGKEGKYIGNEGSNTNKDGNLELLFADGSKQDRFMIGEATITGDAPTDWSSVGEASIGLIGGVLEVAGGVAGEGATLGLSTALVLDGGTRVIANYIKLLNAFDGNPMARTMPTNLGGLAGSAFSQNGQRIGAIMNDGLSIGITGGVSAPLISFIKSPNSKNASNLIYTQGSIYLDMYNNSSKPK